MIVETTAGAAGSGNDMVWVVLTVGLTMLFLMKPVDYHHVHPSLPYIIPVPRRIHTMFSGNNQTHYDNVNVMMGLSFDFPNIIKHIDLEGDI